MKLTSQSIRIASAAGRASGSDPGQPPADPPRRDAARVRHGVTSLRGGPRLGSVAARIAANHCRRHRGQPYPSPGRGPRRPARHPPAAMVGRDGSTCPGPAVERSAVTAASVRGALAGGGGGRVSLPRATVSGGWRLPATVAAGELVSGGWRRLRLSLRIMALRRSGKRACGVAAAEVRPRCKRRRGRPGLGEGGARACVAGPPLWAGDYACRPCSLAWSRRCMCTFATSKHTHVRARARS